MIQSTAGSKLNLLAPNEKLYDLAADETVFRDCSAKIELRGKSRIIPVSVATIAGNKTKGNEDAGALRVNGSQAILGLFDGAANSIVCPELAALGVNGARFASHTLAEMLQDHAALNPGKILLTLNELLAERSKLFLAQHGVTPDLFPTSTGTVAVIDFERDEIFVEHVADSILMLFYADGNSQIVTPDQVGHTVVPIVEDVKREMKRTKEPPRLIAQRPEYQSRIKENCLRNFNAPSGDGFGALNGSQEIAQYLWTTRLPLKGVESLLLVSDGFLPPSEDHNDLSVRERLMSLMRAEGLKGVYKWKSSVEDSDPDWHHIRFKHSDDSTGIWLRLAN